MILTWEQVVYHETGTVRWHEGRWLVVTMKLDTETGKIDSTEVHGRWFTKGEATDYYEETFA